MASLLKLNHQVLVRKLQAGEIPAYKIGKDWRIEEGELRAWLASVSNRPVWPERHRGGGDPASLLRRGQAQADPGQEKPP